MDNAHEVEGAAAKFTQILNTAAKLPGVRIERDSYLRAALRRYCTEE